MGHDHPGPPSPGDPDPDVSVRRLPAPAPPRLTLGQLSITNRLAHKHLVEHKFANHPQRSRRAGRAGDAGSALDAGHHGCDQIRNPACTRRVCRSLRGRQSTCPCAELSEARCQGADTAMCGPGRTLDRNAQRARESTASTATARHCPTCQRAALLSPSPARCGPAGRSPAGTGHDPAPASRCSALRQAGAGKHAHGRLLGIGDAALAERTDHGCQYIGRLGDAGRVGALGELVEQP